MSNKSSLRKYYVGFVLLMILAIAFLIYAFSQAGGAKQDRATDKAVENIANNLDIYISDNSLIPDSLVQAGIKNVPSSIAYTKLSSSKYKVCVNYSASSGGFDASWTSLYSGALSGAGLDSGGSDHTVFDSSVEFNHKKGLNCQTVTPTVYNANSGRSCPLDSASCVLDNSSTLY